MGQFNFIDVSRIFSRTSENSEDPEFALETQIPKQENVVAEFQHQADKQKELRKARHLLEGLKSKLANIDSQLKKERLRALQALGITDHSGKITKLSSELNELYAEINNQPDATDKNHKLALKGCLEAKQQELKKLQIAHEIEVAKTTRLHRYLFDTQNLALGQKLFGAEFTVAQQSIFDDAKTAQKFKELNERYTYFNNTDPNVLNLYIEFYKLCYYSWVVIENNPNPEEVFDVTYKFMATFLEQDRPEKDLFYTTIGAFINGFCSKYANPIHDIFASVHLPTYLLGDHAGTPDFNLVAWQKLIKTHGLRALEAIGHAPNIKEPRSLDELNKELKALTYKRADNHPSLAKLCFKYKVAEARFNRALDLFNNGAIRPKTRDNLPDIAIDIAKVAGAESRQNHYLLKLPAGDLRGLILGDITACCQSVGGHSEMVAIDGSNLADNGFYVLVKSKQPIDIVQYHSDSEYYKGFWENLEERGHKIIGQGYAWKSRSGNLVLDSWENLNPQSDDPWMNDILTRFAQVIMSQDPSINRVAIGLGGATPQTFQNTQLATREYMLEGRDYGDAENQALIAESEALIRRQNELQQRLNALRISNISVKNFNCISIATQFANLSDDLLIGISNSQDCNIITNPLFIEGNANLAGFYAQLFALPRAVYLLLISEDAQAAYKTGGIKANDLVMFDKAKIKFLFSEGILKSYRIGKVKLSAVISNEQSILELKQCILRQLAFNLCHEELISDRLTENKINLLISWEALEAYKTAGVKVSDLTELEEEKIRLLISWVAQEAYKTTGVKASDLAQLDAEKIKLLISEEAREAYKTGGVRVNDLVMLDKAKIKFLFSEDMIKNYRIGGVRLSGVVSNEQSILELKQCILRQLAFNLCHEEFISDRLTESKLNLLISWVALKVYKTGGVKASDLAQLDVEKIKLLISWNARKAYKTGGVKASDLIECDVEKIQLLVAWNTLWAYATGGVKASDLVALDLKRIELLISKKAQEAYETGGVKASDLVECDVEKIKLLISWQARKAYEIGRVRLIGLILNEQSILEIKQCILKQLVSNLCHEDFNAGQLPENKLDLMISWDAIEAYETGGIKVSDLVSLDLERIELLISENAREAYRSGLVDIKRLSQLSDAEISKVLHLITCVEDSIVLNQASLTLINEDLTLKTLRQLNQCLSCIDTHNLSSRFLEGQVLLANKYLRSSIVYAEEPYISNSDKHDRALAMREFCAKILNQRGRDAQPLYNLAFM